MPKVSVFGFQSIKLILWRNSEVSARRFQSAKLALWAEIMNKTILEDAK